MPRERRRRPDLDERFALDEDDPETVLRRLLGAEDVPLDEDDATDQEEFPT